jgi:outer membrane protein TolC
LSKIKKIEGSEQKQADAERLVSSEFFSEAMWASDKSPVMTPNFNGTDRQSRRFELGIRSQWGGGVRTRFFAVSDNQLLREALAMPQPEMSLEKRGLAAELEWSLLRNGLGREQRFQEEALLASAQGDKTLAKFQATQLLVDAQLLYIRTAQLQEALQIQSELVRQGESLVSWATRQVRDRLLEPVHQSEAEIALEARRLGYEQREVELTTIRQQLFSALEEGQSLVRLESLNRLETQINAPRSLSQRADITARNQYLQAQRSQLLLQKEAYRPDLRLIAQYQGFLKRGSDNDTARCENPTACATRVLGLSFSMPLDQGTQRRGRDGIEAQALSQEWEVKRAQMESERDKRLIQEQLQKMSEQQTILRQLIRKQEERLEAERRRQRQGRATTFELIQAEQQLFEAREQLIVLRGHRLELMTQLKLYEVKP